MRKLAVLASVLLLAACTSIEPRPKPLSSVELVAFAGSGADAKQIIEELRRTDTILPLSASEILRLHDAGVPDEVLDYLQRAQIDEIRWRDRYSQMYWSPLYRGFGPCPWPPSSFMRPYRGGPWGC